MSRRLASDKARGVEGVDTDWTAQPRSDTQGTLARMAAARLSRLAQKSLRDCEESSRGGELRKSWVRTTQMDPCAAEVACFVMQRSRLFPSFLSNHNLLLEQAFTRKRGLIKETKSKMQNLCTRRFSQESTSRTHSFTSGHYFA